MQESYWEERSKRPSIWVERTTITKSATAAAGSGDLHAYRRFKRAETLRRIEEDDEQKEVCDEGIWLATGARGVSEVEGGEDRSCGVEDGKESGKAIEAEEEIEGEEGGEKGPRFGIPVQQV